MRGCYGIPLVIEKRSQMISDYTDILWDFNGTILDDVKTGIDSVNKLLTERGLETIDTLQRYYSVFGFPVIDYYKRLGFDFEKEPYEVVAKQWVSEYLERVKTAGVRKGVKELIEYFSRLGLRQTIISATESSMLTEQVRGLGLEELFDEVLGIGNIYAVSKESTAERWREAHPTAKALFIGDTVHDADVARLINADCILVCGGHQSKEVLLRSGFPVADDIDKIIERI